MCLAIPGRVKAIDGMKLTVEYPHETRQVLDGGVPVKKGDYVLIQMGVVIKKLKPQEVKSAQEGWGIAKKD